MHESSVILSAKDAISRHMQWKMTLQLAIAMREPLSHDQLDQINHYGRCAIGRWLDSPATRSARSRSELNELFCKHLHFHSRMARIAQLIGEGRFEEANAATRTGTPFDLASQALAAAIMACDRASTVAVPL